MRHAWLDLPHVHKLQKYRLMHVDSFKRELFGAVDILLTWNLPFARVVGKIPRSSVEVFLSTASLPTQIQHADNIPPRVWLLLANIVSFDVNDGALGRCCAHANHLLHVLLCYCWCHWHFWHLLPSSATPDSDTCACCVSWVVTSPSWYVQTVVVVVVPKYCSHSLAWATQYR